MVVTNAAKARGAVGPGEGEATSGQGVIKGFSRATWNGR